MNLKERQKAFAQLYDFLKQQTPEERFEWADSANARNGWFTPENVLRSLDGLLNYLEPQGFAKWLENYQTDLERINPRTVGVVMAGNIPMVGIHDWICVLVSGHRLKAKLSSNDSFLIRQLSAVLCEIEPRFAELIELIEDDLLRPIDAVIATGSNHSARYFEYYFGKYPHIIRHNRHSCAVLNGQESREELLRLADDILAYYGLGCRSVSKIFVPKGYIFNDFMEATTEKARACLQNHKYANNYDYNKSIYLINQIPHFDNGFLMLTESSKLASPISVVYYEFYENKAEITTKLEAEAEQIQCVVSAGSWFAGSLELGTSQMPCIFDYADGVDTMRFLVNLR